MYALLLMKLVFHTVVIKRILWFYFHKVDKIASGSSYFVKSKYDVGQICRTVQIFMGGNIDGFDAQLVVRQKFSLSI